MKIQLLERRFIKFGKQQEFKLTHLAIRKTASNHYIISSSDNRIMRNNIINNGYGIWLNYSSSNKIYHNNFVDNTKQIHSLDSTNEWDAGFSSGSKYGEIIGDRSS